jgi:hypothetical protein
MALHSQCSLHDTRDNISKQHLHSLHLYTRYHVAQEVEHQSFARDFEQPCPESLRSDCSVARYSLLGFPGHATPSPHARRDINSRTKYVSQQKTQSRRGFRSDTATQVG